jgi:hypothetical protein
MPANQAPAMTPAHSVRMSSRPCNLTKMIDQRLRLAPSWDLVANAEGGRMWPDRYSDSKASVIHR